MKPCVCSPSAGWLSLKRRCEKKMAAANVKPRQKSVEVLMGFVVFFYFIFYYLGSH